MAIVEVKNLAKSFNGDFIFENLNFEINNGEKVAIIGENGCGKSTVLRCIAAGEHYNAGEININDNIKVGYLSQHAISNMENSVENEIEAVFSYMVELELKVRDLEVQLSKSPNDSKLLEEYSRIYNYFESKGGYDYKVNVDVMLNVLGFDSETRKRPIKSFSGGERTKVVLAKILVEDNNLLILDEPTNHLDIKSIEWLESYLQKFVGALIVVSHDRFFIDNVCNKKIEIENKEASVYHGNYDKYLIEKERRYELQKREYNAQQQHIEKELAWIRKNKTKASKAAQAKDREKKLKALDIVAKPHVKKREIKIKFPEMRIKTDNIFEVVDLNVGYENNILVRDININIQGRDRIAIIGPNGAGKSTFIKTLLGEIKSQSGMINKVKSFKLAYVDQHMSHFDDNKTLLTTFQDEFPEMLIGDVRKQLGKFNFSGYDTDKKMSELSGGERVRATIGLIVLKEFDFLVLDEPTNHLDIPTKIILEDAIKTFPGTVLLISHDRYFVDQIAHKILDFDGRNSKYFLGQYRNYIKLKSEGLPEQTQKKKKKEKNIPKGITPSKIEKKIEKLDMELEKEKKLIFDPEVYSDASEVLKIQLKIDALENEIDELFVLLEEILD